MLYTHQELIREERPEFFALIDKVSPIKYGKKSRKVIVRVKDLDPVVVYFPLEYSPKSRQGVLIKAQRIALTNALHVIAAIFIEDVSTIKELEESLKEGIMHPNLITLKE